MPDENDSKIWSVLWKINQVIVPMITAWAVWVTIGQFNSMSHEKDQAIHVNAKDVEAVAREATRLSHLAELRIVGLEADKAAVHQSLGRIEAELKRIKP